eukprot:jgi/Mesvir1/28162/Mv04724-RA.1
MGWLLRSECSVGSGDLPSNGIPYKQGVRDVLLRAHEAFSRDPGTAWSWCPRGPARAPGAALLSPPPAQPSNWLQGSAEMVQPTGAAPRIPATGAAGGQSSLIPRSAAPCAQCGADGFESCAHRGQGSPPGEGRLSCFTVGSACERGGDLPTACRGGGGGGAGLGKHGWDSGATARDGADLGNDAVDDDEEEQEGGSSQDVPTRKRCEAPPLDALPFKHVRGGGVVGDWPSSDASAPLDLVAMLSVWQAALVECRVCFPCGPEGPGGSREAGKVAGAPLGAPPAAPGKGGPGAEWHHPNGKTGAVTAPKPGAQAGEPRGQDYTPWAKLFNTLVENPSQDDASLEVDMRPGLRLVMPPRSSFYASDIRDVRALIPDPPQPAFDLIVADPPWENKSAARQGTYATLPSRYLLSIPMRTLAHTTRGALLALWVTNREKLRRFVEGELFPAWGVTHVATWYWLKIAQDGSMLSPLDNPHHKPYEPILLGWVRPDTSNRHTCAHDAREPAAVSEQATEGVARCSCQEGSIGRDNAGTAPSFSPPLARQCASPLCKLVARIPDKLVIISPPRQHSRKPHLGRLLRQCLHVEQGDTRQLELFARELSAGWLSWGNEPLKFQSIDHFLEHT